MAQDLRRGTNCIAIPRCGRGDFNSASKRCLWGLRMRFAGQRTVKIMRGFSRLSLVIAVAMAAGSSIEAGAQCEVTIN